jgi:hypothetical protein
MGKLSLLISFVMLLSGQVLAVDSVRLHPDNDLVINGRVNGVTFPLGLDEPSGDATSESAPGRVYVPMEGPQGSEVDFFIERSATDIFDNSDTNRLIQFPLYLNVGSTNKYLYAAAKEGSNQYKVIKFDSGGNPYVNRTNADIVFSISPADICAQVSGDCDDFPTQVLDRTYKIYFFLSTTSPAGLPYGTDAPPSTYPDGIYFEVKMSNRVYVASTLTPIITAIKVGDKRLNIEYSSAGGILEPDSVRIFRHTSAPGGTGQPINSLGIYTGSLESEEYPYLTSGEITLRGLQNDTDYVVSVLFVNKYKFGTVLSDDATGRPLEIQELLKKESCFLLTAGFGEEHFVIDYFRKFRDRVLSKSTLGRMFITNYYEYAPKYALLIYDHEFIRFGIRMLSYCLYFIFTNFYYLAGGLFFLITGYLFSKSQKKKHQFL